MPYAKFHAYILIIKKMRTIYVGVLLLVTDDAQITRIRKLSPIFDELYLYIYTLYILCLIYLI